MKQNKNLLIIANSPITKKSIGGGDRFVIETTPYLSKKFKTSLITPEVGYHHWHTKPKTINFITHPENVFDNKDNKMAITITYLIRTLLTFFIFFRQKSQIIISSTHLFPDIIPAFIFKIFKGKFIWVCRVYQIIPQPAKRPGNIFINTITYLHQQFMLRLIKKADLIIADNYLMIDFLIKIGSVRKNIVFLPNGVDIERIRKYKQKKTYPASASYIGRLDPNKGIFDLVAIWKQVVDKLPFVKLAICGYGSKDTTQKLKTAFKKASLLKNVLFTGFLSHNKGKRMPLFDLILSSKVIILPEAEGGIPLTVLEALSCSIPVVCYKRPELSRIPLEGLIQVPIGDRYTFSKKVLTVLSQPGVKNKKLRSSFVNTFSWKKISEKYITLLNRL